MANTGQFRRKTLTIYKANAAGDPIEDFPNDIVDEFTWGGITFDTLSDVQFQELPEADYNQRLNYFYHYIINELINKGWEIDWFPYNYTYPTGYGPSGICTTCCPLPKPVGFFTMSMNNLPAGWVELIGYKINGGATQTRNFATQGPITIQQGDNIEITIAENAKIAEGIINVTGFESYTIGANKLTLVNALYNISGSVAYVNWTRANGGECVIHVNGGYGNLDYKKTIGGSWIVYNNTPFTLSPNSELYIYAIPLMSVVTQQELTYVSHTNNVIKFSGAFGGSTIVNQVAFVILTEAIP